MFGEDETTVKADAHIHLFRDGFFGEPGSQVGVGEYESLRILGDIDEALVVGYEGDPRYAGNNEYILELAQSRPWMKPLYYLDVDAAPSREKLQALRAEGYLGFALYLKAGDSSFAHWPASTLQYFAEESSIVSFNVDLPSLSTMAPVLSDMSTSSVLISHLGLPGPIPAGEGEGVRDRLSPLLELSGLPHISVKLSGLYAIDPHFPHRGSAYVVDEVVRAFGARRLLWGSDFSPALGYSTEEQISRLPPWLEAEFAPTELEDVVGRNLRRVLQRVGNYGK